MELLRTFGDPAFTFGLSSWVRLGIHGKTPRFATLFGDVFLESLDGWWFLDTVDGTLELRWPTAVELKRELDSDEGRADILLEDIAQEAAQHGIVPHDDEVITFMPHPRLGGRLSVQNAVTMRFELALRLAGDVHQQMSDSSSPLLLGHSLDHGSSTSPQAMHGY